VGELHAGDRFTAKPLAKLVPQFFVGGSVLGQTIFEKKFDCHTLPVRSVTCCPHNAHAPLAQDAIEYIPVVEYFAYSHDVCMLSQLRVERQETSVCVDSEDLQHFEGA
jgi:hypothetical protein